jgi:hypothetical protein
MSSADHKPKNEKATPNTGIPAVMGSHFKTFP